MPTAALVPTLESTARGQLMCFLQSQEFFKRILHLSIYHHHLSVDTYVDIVSVCLSVCVYTHTDISVCLYMYVSISVHLSVSI